MIIRTIAERLEYSNIRLVAMKLFSKLAERSMF